MTDPWFVRFSVAHVVFMAEKINNNKLIGNNEQVMVSTAVTVQWTP